MLSDQEIREGRDGLSIGQEGLSARISPYGGLLRTLCLQLADGSWLDIVQGYARPEDYGRGNPYQGAIIGRTANRIRSARYAFRGQEIPLVANHGPHQLHGGPDGCHNRVWRVDHHDPHRVDLSLLLPDGASGFPGNLHLTWTYEILPGLTLRMSWTAETDAPTPVNLTHHAYFNLEGHDRPLIDGHRLMVPARAYAETDDDLVATGRILPVEGTILDLRHPVRLGDILGSSAPEFRFAGGLDHHFVLEPPIGILRPVARLHAPATGVILNTWTDQAGLQVYTANMENNPQPGKHGQPYGRRSAICLECQAYPDAVNQPGFPSWILEPGEIRTGTIEFRFGLRNDPPRSSGGSLPNWA